jgi:hypothetical protein
MDSHDAVLENACSFDFISDVRFRLSLQSDYRELINAFETCSWKAAHVLSGSIVEALLVDYLAVCDYQKKLAKTL